MYLNPLVSNRLFQRLVAIAIGIIIGLLLLLVTTAANHGATAAPMFQPSVRDRPAGELPREWRYGKPTANHDHMFMAPRRNAASGHSDWIRDNRR